MSVDRLERINSLLKRVIAEGMFQVMQGDSVPAGMITVTGVQCGKDLRDASVCVSVFGDDELKERAVRHLKAKAREFQSLINRQVRMKFTPRLTFKLDLSLEKGDEVLALLDKLEHNDSNS
ncbi:MAG: 30S ribosome-binding factor RbfA [Lentisphaerae bacterium]|jgi:ribosome-binding factor A|nr:30S ribosome-binding factor RbfA [Lentisphaerota bacterium]